MRITIVGADGKMGQQLLTLVQKTENVQLVGAVVQDISPFKQKKLRDTLSGCESDLVFSDDAEHYIKNSEAVIDFTRPAGTIFYNEICAHYKVAHIIGTTGLTEQDIKILEKNAQNTIIVKSGNMSYGVNLLAALVEKAAHLLSAKDFDIEITEMHHRFKVDSPSGTALLLGEAAAKGRGQALNDIAILDHGSQNQPRKEGTIGFSAQRGGTVIGDHHVIFAGDNERIMLSHMAQDRSIFALGALKAALWTEGKSAGLYSMKDVLNI